MQDAVLQIGDTENNSMVDWDDLYYDLKNERAVLILGPDFHRDGEASVKEQLYKEVSRRSDNGIVHFYPMNGIFLFKSEYYKAKTKRIAAEFYKSLAYDHVLLQKIIDLPFRLIINTNPDRSLEKKYIEKNIQCQFDYFTAGLKREEREIAEPDKFFPLIFNLFGSVDSLDSLVLDFEDIFDHLTASLNNRNISEVIRSILRETDSFIFVGFHYEKWDTQLLFRYLNSKKHSFDDSKKNYTTRSLNIDLDSESFFRQQFNLKYYGAPVDFINTLHKKYFELSASEDREQIQGLSPQNVIEHFIGNDDTEKALNYLTNILESKELMQELILLKSNFSRYHFQKARKLEQADYLEVAINKINQGILELVSHI